MAGHSKFKNIMHRKGRQDKLRSKIFSKLAKEITVAAKEGGDPNPDNNPRLRLAVAAAKKENMPNDNIKRAIDRAFSSTDGSEYSEIRYEGYGPKTIAFIIETLTDNKNRTASDVRAAFSKNGGNLGETNSVAFNFKRLGEIVYKNKIGTSEEVLEAAIEAGAEDVESDDEEHRIYMQPDDLHASLTYLEKKFGEPEKAELTWKPITTLSVNKKEDAEKIMNFIEILEDLDDVQKVYYNCDIDDKILAELE
jgi:YebC/PmpR family DNA-binding regulatory protein